MNILGFFYLGIAILGAEESIRAMVSSRTLTGPALFQVINPALAALHQISPKLSVPADLAASICQAVADTVNTYHGPKPPALPPQG